MVVREPANADDPAGYAKAAFAKGDCRWVRGEWDLLGPPGPLTEYEWTLGRGAKVVVFEGTTLGSGSDAKSKYAAAYNRARADLLKSSPRAQRASAPAE